MGECSGYIFTDMCVCVKFAVSELQRVREAGSKQAMQEEGRKKIQQVL